MPGRTKRQSSPSEGGSGSTTPSVSFGRRHSTRLSGLDQSSKSDDLDYGLTRDHSGHVVEVDDSEADELASSAYSVYISPDQ